MKKILLYGILLIILISCSTMDPIYLQSELNKAMLVGKVITEEGLPLEGVTVKMNNSQSTKTDINGKFLYNYIVYGKYNLTFEKEDYLSTNYNFTFNFIHRKIPFVKVKMLSLNYLVDESFELLKENKFKDVDENIKKIERINNDLEILLYLKAIYNYTQNKYNEALPLLEELRKRDTKNIYYQLTLVEVYKKLEKYEEMVNLCLYITHKNPKEYLDYLKLAYETLRDKLNNQEEYEKIKKEYDTLVNDKK